MSDILILGLPRAADLAAQAPEHELCSAPYWAHIADGQMVASGVGDGWRLRRDHMQELAAKTGDMWRYAVLAPAWDAPVRYHSYVDAAPAQAATAARLEVQQQILGAPDEQHIVAAVPRSIGEPFAISVISHRAMAAWTAWLAAQGIAADEAIAIMPAAALWNAAGDGALVGARLGDGPKAEQVMRSAQLGYAADPVIDGVLGGGGQGMIWLTDAERDDSIAAAAMQPMMDLRSGRWAVKRRRTGHGAVWARVKYLAVALVTLSILIFAVQMMRVAADRSRADQAVMEKAQSLKISAGDAASAEAEIDRRLMERGGGPLAFSVPASALYAILRDAPAVSIKSLAYREDGTLTVSLAAPRVEDLNPVLVALQAKGYHISAQPMAGSDGQQMANITIRAVP